MKTKFCFLTAMFILYSFAGYNQVTEGEKQLKTKTADTSQGWRTGGVISLNMSQTSLTNWAAGGQQSVALNGLFSTFANFKKGKSAWDNSLDLGLGFLNQFNDFGFMKTDDKIDFTSKYGQQAFSNFYYAGLLNFKTQMAPGYNYPNDSVKISDLLAPGYLLGAVGMDYKPDQHFSAFLAPFTGKVTIVNNKELSNARAFGVDSGKTIKSEFGGYIRMIYSKNDFKNELLKNVSFTTKADLFSNYLNNPEKIDISWETLIAMKVNKYISVSLSTHLLYDFDVKIGKDENKDKIISADEIKDRIQFKEILGVGFSYKF